MEKPSEPDIDAVPTAAVAVIVAAPAAVRLAGSIWMDATDFKINEKCSELFKCLVYSG